MSGLREAYFGAMFHDQQAQLAKCVQRHGSDDCHPNASAAGLAHVARFVESFETPEHDLWLVRAGEQAVVCHWHINVCMCARPRWCACHNLLE